MLRCKMKRWGHCSGPPHGRCGTIVIRKDKTAEAKISLSGKAALNSFVRRCLGDANG